MSDLLSGLDTFDAMTDDLLGNGLDNIYVRKSDVTEALRNPDDRQVAAIDAVWRADHYPVVVTETGQIRCACGDAGDRDLHRVCVTLAAAAGGDQ